VASPGVLALDGVFRQLTPVPRRTRPGMRCGVSRQKNGSRALWTT
jgi:hypothetical protein